MLTINEIKALNEARTMGNWDAFPFAQAKATKETPGINKWKVPVIQLKALGAFSEADALFISAAPSIAKIAIALSEENARLKKAIEDHDGQIDFIHRWVERGLFSETTSPEGALTIIALAPDAPWNSDKWDWDVDHKEYAKAFYEKFPNARKQALNSEAPHD